MNRIEDIYARRAALIQLAAAQRQQFAAELAPWRVPLAIADSAIGAARVVTAHPWLGVAGAAVLGLRARRTITWVRRGYRLWRAWRVLSSTLREVADEFSRERR